MLTVYVRAVLEVSLLVALVVGPKTAARPGQKLSCGHVARDDTAVIVAPAVGNAKPGRMSVHIAATAAAKGPLVLLEAAMERVVTVPTAKTLAE